MGADDTTDGPGSGRVVSAAALPSRTSSVATLSGAPPLGSVWESSAGVPLRGEVTHRVVSCWCDPNLPPPTALTAKNDKKSPEIRLFMAARLYFYKVNELCLTLMVCFPTHESS